jgi:hypothetical protein
MNAKPPHVETRKGLAAHAPGTGDLADPWHAAPTIQLNINHIYRSLDPRKTLALKVASSGVCAKTVRKWMALTTAGTVLS